MIDDSSIKYCTKVDQIEVDTFENKYKNEETISMKELLDGDEEERANKKLIKMLLKDKVEEIKISNCYTILPDRLEEETEINQFFENYNKNTTISNGR